MNVMNDTEDELILEDIRALENALSRKTELHDIPVVSLKKEINPFNVHHPQKTEIRSIDLQSSQSFSVNNEENTENTFGSPFDSTAALELNQKLIERLTATRNEIAEILEECKRKKGAVGIKIKQRLRQLPNTKVLLSHAGMPYFKDKDFFAAPANDDTKLKEARGQLQIIHLRRVSRWTVKDKEILLRAVHHEVVCGFKNLNEKEENSIESMTTWKSRSLPPVILNAIGRLGQREFDWMKIAVIDFQNKHSPEECRVMWNVFLHPDINKFKWKTKELADLDTLAKSYKYQNWDTIANDLGTQRSGYQCFVKYNTTNKSQVIEKPWVKSEDTKLVHLVNKFKIGDYINWGDIASCMENRTKQQIYFRWMYSLAPHLKKGRFTDQEDKLLIGAIEKYGLNFKKISTLVLPTRTSAQLNDRYNTMCTNKELNLWTVEQDALLVALFNEYGNDWAKIATFFDCKTRVQLRHRHASLLRYEKRGIMISDIPRDNSRLTLCKQQTLVFQRVPMRRPIKIQEFDDLDKEIIDYFHKVNVPSSKAGRPQKFYREEELQSLTRKMYNLLQFLNAKLKIPYDLDEYDCLSEKDKQLLNSLKNLSHDAAYGAAARNAEQKRLHMFGFGRQEENEQEDEHFIPPLPFGGYVKTNRFQQMINYSLFIGHKFLEEREMTFATPFKIIEVIGEEDNHEFDKLGDLLVRPNYKSQRQIMNSIYILTPHELERREVEKSYEMRPYVPLPSTSASNSDVIVLGAYKNNLLSKECNVNIPSMKPNYWTLLGYQQILIAMNEMNPENMIDCSVNAGTKIREKERLALEKLRMRLVQLFKYPIIMSQVMPPEPLHEGEELLNQKINSKRKTEFARQPNKKRKKTSKE